MIDPFQISEHMKVVGSDGEHVGTIDHLCIKLRKNDPATHGQHHVLKVNFAAKMEENMLKLLNPASEALQQEKALQE